MVLKELVCYSVNNMRGDGNALPERHDEKFEQIHNGG
jgi:hypothetical protein